MSDFSEAFIDLLSVNSSLNDVNNPFRKVIDGTVGAWFDENNFKISDLFINTATGKYLDLFGADYGVLRKLDESDEDYRNRIIFEKLDYLTAHNLENIYGLTLYCYVNGFDATDNDLTSDNPYICSKYMSFADDELKTIINNKFVIGEGIIWL